MQIVGDKREVNRPITDPEEWLRRNGTFWCPRLKLRARPEFCEALRRRPVLSHVYADWVVDGRPLRPAACDGCPGPEGLEASVERRVRRLLEVHKPQEPEPPSGGEIRQLRARLGLTQAQLARKLRISPQLVSQWEHGKVCVRSEYLQKLIKLGSRSGLGWREKLMPMEPWERKLLYELKSEKCSCGRKKKRHRPFCFRCFMSLPEPIRRGLYKEFNSGYQEARIAAGHFLGQEEFLRFEVEDEELLEALS